MTGSWQTTMEAPAPRRVLSGAHAMVGAMVRRPSCRFATRQIWPVGAPLVLTGFMLIARACGVDALVSWLLGVAAPCLLVTLALVELVVAS